MVVQVASFFAKLAFSVKRVRYAIFSLFCILSVHINIAEP